MREYTILRRERKGMTRNDVDVGKNAPSEHQPMATEATPFKVAKMREAIMEDQDEFLMRNAEYADVDVYTNNIIGHTWRT